MANVPEQLDIVEIARWLGAPTARPKKFEVITKENKRRSPLRRRGSAGGGSPRAFGSERGLSPKRPSITSAGASATDASNAPAACDGKHGRIGLHGRGPTLPLGTPGFELTWRGRPWWTRLVTTEAHAGSGATAMGVLASNTSDPAGRMEERAAMLSRLREAEAFHDEAASSNSCWCASSAMGMQGVEASNGGMAFLVPGRRSAPPTSPPSYLTPGQPWLPSAIASGDAREHRLLVVLGAESSMAHASRGNSYPVTRPEHWPHSPRSPHPPRSPPSPPSSPSPPCSPRLRVSSAASHQSRLRRRSADPLANQLSQQIYGFVAL